MGLRERLFPAAVRAVQAKADDERQGATVAREAAAAQRGM